MNYDIKNIIANFAQKGVDNTQYNPFAMLNLNENGYTKMLLSFLAYRDINGWYPVLQSFLFSFAKGRDKMIHYKRPSNVELQFSPCLDTDLIDGLITFEAGGKKHAVIIENKIFDAPDQPGQVRRYINLVKKHKDVALDFIGIYTVEDVLDARWTKKGGETFYGYKNHAKVCRKTKLIMGYDTTSASVHDSKRGAELVDSNDPPKNS